MTSGRRPCLIGVAQKTIHPEEGDAPEPLLFWSELALEAAADSGGHDIVQAIDDVNVVHSLSWHYDDAAARLAEHLGLREGRRQVSGLSGTSSQKMLCSAAERILNGESDLALIAGAESLATKKRMKKAGARPEWSHPAAGRKRPPLEDPFDPSEMAHQLFQAYMTFALFDVARRVRVGLSPEENLQQLGRCMAPMTEVAAANPYAWFRRVQSAEELIRVTPRNRMIATPYPMHLVAIMDVDMGSALLLASEEKADALGVPQDRRVYLRSWAHAKDPLRVAEREDLGRSVAIEETSHSALAGAGVEVDEIEYFDLYSCFASSMNFARDALGVSPADPRPFTVTGGLPFHGGPGSGYVGHAIASLVPLLREKNESYGMTSGIGMHMAHHSYAIFSGTPGSVTPPDAVAIQARVDAVPVRPLAAEAKGPAEVASYSVVYDREGPRFALAVCDLPSGERCYARADDADLVVAMAEGEWVGRSFSLRADGKGVNCIQP